MKQLEEKMGGAGGGLNRAKKTPEEIAAEQAQAEQDDFTSKLAMLHLGILFITWSGVGNGGREYTREYLEESRFWNYL